METIGHLISALSNFLWGWPMIVMLLGTHIYLTIRLRFPQRHILTAIRLSIHHDHKAKGDVSQFGALATSLAATIGTGNIIGVATAVSMGGPGAVLWCWLTGVLGIATKYAEGLLAVKYRVEQPGGQMLGGPMYALERGLHLRWLAIAFCVFTAVAALGIGDTIQANSIALLSQSNWGIPPYATGLAMCILTAVVTLFGLKGISRACTAFVPFMGISYIVGCLYILIVNHAYLGSALALIVTSAFDPHAAIGGMAGSGIMIAARYGIARGLFSNESGLGSAPIVAAAARTRNPVRQALVSSTGTFWDTVVICALTGLVLVSSIVAYPDIHYTDGARLTHLAFSKIPYVGSLVLTTGLFTFSYSTILGWSYYGEKAIEYLGGRRLIIPYRILWVIGVFIGSVAQLNLIWNISDCMNAFMAIPNLISLIFLTKIIVKETDKYLWKHRLDASE